MSRASPDDALVASTFQALLAARAPGASICPSEVARALAPEDEQAWRALMPRVRAVAATLARQGQLRITRRGRDLAPEQIDGGPIRLHRGDRG